MIIACFIPALAWLIKKMNLDRDEQPVDLAMPIVRLDEGGASHRGGHRRRPPAAQMIRLPNPT